MQIVEVTIMRNRFQEKVSMDEKKAVKLWTIQHEEAYRVFKETGILRANNNYLFCEDGCTYAYDWIAGEMKKRIGESPVADIKYPIWAWYQWEGKRKRQDLRCSGYAKRGTPMVQLEIEVPVNEILLSDFDAWFFVMSYEYIYENEDDYNAFNKRHEVASKLRWGIGCDNNDPRLYEMLKEIRESWPKVFDLENSHIISGVSKAEQSIQATMWQITMDQVRRVEHFIAK